MSEATFLMNIGTWILCIATIPQLRTVLANKDDLKGLSTIFSTLSFVGLLFITFAFIYLKIWLSVAAQILPLITFGFSSFYPIYKYLKE